MRLNKEKDIMKNKKAITLAMRVLTGRIAQGTLNDRTLSEYQDAVMVLRNMKAIVAPKPKIKDFLIGCIPNRDTWGSIDKNYYSHLLEEVEQDDGSSIHVFDQYIEAETEAQALDKFHSDWPIKCLDDWNIDCVEMNPTTTECPKCETRIAL